ncbi:YceI family protein [Asaia sp. BMEF1]|uniref:YceI family protein n=1 Tax=unclassified Asaia TaxID=2685023 RepID=UPI003018D6CE
MMSALKAFAPACVLLGALASHTTAQAAEWQVEKDHSQLGFSGTQTGSAFKGVFTRYEPLITLDPAQPEKAHIELSIDLASAKTGDTQRDTALPGSDWFDIAHFPKAHFVSTSLRQITGEHYQAIGTLTLRNLTHPVTLDFTLHIEGNKAHAQGQAAFSRALFGVGQGPWASGQWVGLPVTVTFDFVADQAK